MTFHRDLKVVMSHMGKCPMCFLCCNKIIGTLRELGSLSIQALLKHPVVFSDLSINILLCFGMVAPFFYSLWSRYIYCVLTICPYRKVFFGGGLFFICFLAFLVRSIESKICSSATVIFISGYEPCWWVFTNTVVGAEFFWLFYCVETNLRKSVLIKNCVQIPFQS